MTRLEIRDMIRKKLGETTSAFWSDAELNSWINEAGEDIAFKAKCLRTNTTITTVVNTSDYDISTYISTLSSILQVYYKTNGTTWKKMDPLPDREALDRDYPGWMNTSAGVPDKYMYDKEEDNFMIYPKPNSSNAGAYCKVFFARTFPTLSSDSASPTLPEPLHLAIVDFVVALGYESRGYGDKANDALLKYNSKIQTYKVERNREKEDDEILMRSYRR